MQNRNNFVTIGAPGPPWDFWKIVNWSRLHSIGEQDIQHWVKKISQNYLCCAPVWLFCLAHYTLFVAHDLHVEASMAGYNLIVKYTKTIVKCEK